jgi:hypothetical protein
VALQAHIDGSGNPEHSPALILSGFIASADEWMKFSDAWDQALKMPPVLGYFKMNEAVRLKGQFAGWTEERRDERLRLLYSIIEDHVAAAVLCIMPFKAFYDALTIFPRKLKLRPYHLAFVGLMAMVRDFQVKMGLTEKIDFIFDEESTEKTFLLREWPRIIEGTPEPTKHLVGRTPIFRDDEDVLPLQAADMIAWWGRNAWEAKFHGGVEWQRPWQERRQIPNLNIFYNDRNLRDFCAQVLERVRNRK